MKSWWDKYNEVILWLWNYFKNTELAVAGYNAGHRNVVNAGFVTPPFKETQNYVLKVLGENHKTQNDNNEI